MSGICGIVTFDGAAVVPSDVEVMVSRTPHRGLVRQRWAADGVALVRQDGQETPETQHDLVAVGDVVVLADARIDNRRELSTSLRRAGRQITGGVLDADGGVSDTSLLASAYGCWGPSFVERIIGDFAVAVWDRRRRRLVMARDAMGMRPLYYRFEAGRRLVLASEAKQILALPGVPADVNERAVATFLVAQPALSGDESYWHGVSHVAAGHVLVCSDSGLSRRRYWDIDPQHRVVHRDEATAAEHLAQIFTEAVAARLRSSTSPGVLLSGGLDSGSAAAVAGMLVCGGHVSPRRLSTYSWAFDELTECDERHISDHVVRHYGLYAHDVPADHAGPLADFPSYDVDRDDPFVGAFQPVIERSLEQARADNVDVMLGGDRGDLVLGDTGVSYLRIAQARKWAALRSEVHEHRRALGDPVVAMLRRHLIDAVAGRILRRDAAGWVRWARHRLLWADDPPAPARPPWITEAFARRVSLGELRATIDVPGDLGFARAARYRFIFTPLHMRGMVWSERTYAKHGIGFADPFSDRRVVEFALALPQAVINRPGDQSKPLLRRSMGQIMPEPARSAATKILPTPLYHRGLRRAEPTIRTLLTNARTARRGWLDAAELLQHYEAWLAGRPLDPAFWYALSVERWLRVQENGDWGYS